LVNADKIYVDELCLYLELGLDECKKMRSTTLRYSRLYKKANENYKIKFLESYEKDLKLDLNKILLKENIINLLLFFLKLRLTRQSCSLQWHHNSSKLTLTLLNPIDLKWVYL